MTDLACKSQGGFLDGWRIGFFFSLPCQIGGDGRGLLEVFFVGGTWPRVPEGGSDPVGCTGVVEIVHIDHLVPEGSKMCREGYSLRLGYLVER